jgi:hypothetical protein
MIKGGKGGASTNRTGLRFERDTSLQSSLEANGFTIHGDDIYSGGLATGLLLGKHKLYKFLDAENVDWRNIISAQLLPDDAVLSKPAQRLTIVEKKWQEVSGSVDEKLQTCGFKLRQYRKLAEPLGLEVKYVYLLNDWFSHPRYQDVLSYIQEVGADFHFKSLPLELLALD